MASWVEDNLGVEYKNQGREPKVCKILRTNFCDFEKKKSCLSKRLKKLLSSCVLNGIYSNTLYIIKVIFEYRTKLVICNVYRSRPCEYSSRSRSSSNNNLQERFSNLLELSSIELIRNYSK